MVAALTEDDAAVFRQLGWTTVEASQTQPSGAPSGVQSVPIVRMYGITAEGVATPLLRSMAVQCTGVICVP
jgi:hypothetical protein